MLDAFWLTGIPLRTISALIKKLVVWLKAATLGAIILWPAGAVVGDVDSKPNIFLTVELAQKIFTLAATKFTTTFCVALLAVKKNKSFAGCDAGKLFISVYSADCNPPKSYKPFGITKS